MRLLPRGGSRSFHMGESSTRFVGGWRDLLLMLVCQDEIQLESAQEYRRREAAVEATRMRMKELASEAAVNSQTGTSVKIKETVTL